MKRSIAIVLSLALCTSSMALALDSKAIATTAEAYGAIVKVAGLEQKLALSPATTRALKSSGKVSATELNAAKAELAARLSKLSQADFRAAVNAVGTANLGLVAGESNAAKLLASARGATATGAPVSQAPQVRALGTGAASSSGIVATSTTITAPRAGAIAGASATVATRGNAAGADKLVLSGAKPAVATAAATTPGQVNALVLEPLLKVEGVNTEAVNALMKLNTEVGFLSPSQAGMCNGFKAAEINNLVKVLNETGLAVLDAQRARLAAGEATQAGACAYANAFVQELGYTASRALSVAQETGSNCRTAPAGMVSKIRSCRVTAAGGIAVAN